MSARTHPRARFLYRINDPWPLSHIVKIASLQPEPTAHTHTDKLDAEYIEVDASARALILAYYAEQKPPTFIALPIPAEKDLSGMKRLGRIELPNWPCTPSERIPAQDDYPVPYFFYSTLAEPKRLGEVLGLENEPELKQAKVRYGKLLSVDGKHHALVNAKQEDEVEGRMFMIENKEQEDAVLLHEGVSYEVVRCKIEMDGAATVKGLTLRFCGDRGALKSLERQTQ